MCMRNGLQHGYFIHFSALVTLKGPSIPLLNLHCNSTRKSSRMTGPSPRHCRAIVAPFKKACVLRPSGSVLLLHVFYQCPRHSRTIPVQFQRHGRATTSTVHTIDHTGSSTRPHAGRATRHTVFHTVDLQAQPDTPQSEDATSQKLLNIRV